MLSLKQVALPPSGQKNLYNTALRSSVWQRPPTWMHCSHHHTASRQLYLAQRPSPSRLGIRPWRNVPAKARMMLLRRPGGRMVEFLVRVSLLQALIEETNCMNETQKATAADSLKMSHQKQQKPIRTEPQCVSQWAASVLWERWRCLCPSNGKSQRRNEEDLNNIN